MVKWGEVNITKISFITVILIISLVISFPLYAGEVNWQQIRNELENDIVDNPEDIITGFKYAVALANTGEIVESYQHINKLGEEYSKQEFNREINPHLDQLEDEPENIRYLNYAGFAAIINNDYQTAIRYLERVVELEKDNVWIENYLASCYLELDDFEQAEKIIQHARQKKDTRFSHLLLGVIYYKQGHKARAVIEFAQSGRLFTALLNELN